MGAGEIGNALAHILRSKKEVDLVMWDKNIDKVPGQTPLPEALRGKDVVFLCMPSPGLHGAIFSLREHLDPSTVVVTLTKGIERETCKTIDDLLEEKLPPTQPWALLSGPMIGEELLQGRPGAAIIGTREHKTFERVAQLFTHTQLSVMHHPDVKGVALCGVLKNVYAVALGCIEALGDGDNLRGMFFSQALEEMQHAIRLLGGDPRVALTVAGIGDLVATATSPYSRNRTVGEELIKHRAQRMESEGLGALPCIPTLLKEHLAGLPLLSALCDVVHKGIPPTELITAIRQ